MSIYDTNSIKPFDNEVVAIKFENQLETKLNMAQFATADNQLAENAGMKKKIRKYIGSGDVEELAMTEGNSGLIGAHFEEVEYVVGTTQGKSVYYDEQVMDDPAVIDKVVNHQAEVMANDLTDKIVAELGKATHKNHVSAFNFDSVSDAIATFPKEGTEDEGTFLLINRKDATLWRKALKDDLKYVEAFVRTGYIGTVCGVPMYMSDAVPAGKAFLATREAVTIFVKKGVEVESQRDADHRKNELYIRKVALVALTNDDKAIVITTAADPREGYILVASKPADWDSKYATDYYFYDAAADTLALNTEADWDKVSGRIYEAE